MTIRPATAEDVEAAVTTLALAFADYPFTRHTIAADAHAERVARSQRLFLTRVGLPHGRVWVSEHAEAVAVWTTPETDDFEQVFAELVPELADIAGDRAVAAAEADFALAPHRPDGPAWFLGTVGVRPGAQGRGLGRAVIQPGLDAAAAAGVPAFLETSTERNVGFYRTLGFDVVAEVDLPGGPKTWAMSRLP